MHVYFDVSNIFLSKIYNIPVKIKMDQDARDQDAREMGKMTEHWLSRLILLGQNHTVHISFGWFKRLNYVMYSLFLS